MTICSLFRSEPVLILMSESCTGKEAGKGGASTEEPSGHISFCAVLEAVQSQVPKSEERERVLDAGRHLASGTKQKVVRSLAGKWGVQQKVGRANRGT